MSEMIVGYQWGDNKAYMCTYSFPNNLDKEEIHLPPNTTLIAPPIVEDNKEAFWSGTKWDIRDKLPLSTHQ